MKKSIAALVLTALLALLGCTAALAAGDDAIDSRQELFDYIWARAQQRPAQLTLPPATAWDISGYLAQIEDVLWRSGAVSYHSSYDRSGKTGVTLDPIQWREEPFYLCETESDIIAALKSAKETGTTSFGLYAADGTIDLLFEDDFVTFYQLLLQSGYAPSTSFSYSPDTSILIRTPVHTSAPTRAVETEEELISALQSMYRAGHQEFYLTMSETLAASCVADNQWLNRLHSRALVTDASCSIYTQLRTLYYTSLECEESAVVLTTLEEVEAYLQGVVDDNLQEVWLFCTTEVMEELLSSVPLGGESTSVLDVLGNRVGLMYFNSVVYNDSNKLRLHTMTISPARRILNAVRRNDYAALTSRELALLSVARDIVAALDADTPTACLWALQAALADRITYTVDPTTDDDDCAFGALLRGEANCDGYADAFDLCAGLAGFETMMVSGYSSDPETGEAAGHAWNLVRVWGQWYFVDATWADGSVLRPMYFLLGRDRAPLFYTWPESLCPALAAQTLTGQTPYTDLAFSTLEELADYLALCDTQALGDVSVFMPAMTLHADEAASDMLQTILQGTSYRHAYTMDHGLLLVH